VSRIELLALDVDGTLAAARHAVSPATRGALARLVEAGVTVCIATGRRPRTTGYVVESLGFGVPVVCLGGALVKDHAGQRLHGEPIDRETLAAVAGMAREHGQAVVGQRDALASGGPDFLLDAGSAWNGATHTYFENNASYASRLDFAAATPADVLMAGVFGPRPQLEALAAALHGRWPRRFLTSVVSQPNPEWGEYCEIAPSHVSKWAGLQRLASHLGVEAAGICAVGDQVNDLPMIREAGMGIAMGNAVDEVKDAADWVCGRHDEDGLVEVVERILAERA